MYNTAVTNQEFEIICVCETWLDANISNTDVALEDYQLFRKDRNRHGGGVAIYVKNSIPVKEIDLLFDGLESVGIEIIVSNKKIAIICCYRPPGLRNQADDFIENFQYLLDTLYANKYDSLFIGGDFNDRCINWDDNHMNSELGTRFKECIRNNILFQLIKDPTYLSPNYQSTLDLIITDSPGYVIKSGIGCPLGDPCHCCFL